MLLITETDSATNYGSFLRMRTTFNSDTMEINEEELPKLCSP